jgi:hypothetical protein
VVPHCRLLPRPRLRWPSLPCMQARFPSLVSIKSLACWCPLGSHKLLLLMVSGIPESVTEAQVNKLFREVGKDEDLTSADITTLPLRAPQACL